MTLFYEGTDMNAYCRVESALCHDRSGQNLDSMEITVGDAAQWEAWKPQTDDRIEIREGNWSSGVMYLTEITAENGSMTMTATSVKRAGRRKSYATYRDIKLRELYAIASAECGMETGIFGMDGDLLYPFVIRNGESMLKLLSRITELEGGRMKACAGRINAIGLDYASGLNPVTAVQYHHGDKGTVYRKGIVLKQSEMTVSSNSGYVTAHDPNAEGNATTTRAPMAGNITDCGRWARGMLLQHNRMAEIFEIDGSLDLRFTAMDRIDIGGGTEADGKWICEEADHDLINKTTWTKMLRVIEGIR